MCYNGAVTSHRQPLSLLGGCFQGVWGGPRAPESGRFALCVFVCSTLACVLHIPHTNTDTNEQQPALLVQLLACARQQQQHRTAATTNTDAQTDEYHVVTQHQQTALEVQASIQSQVQQQVAVFLCICVSYAPCTHVLHIIMHQVEAAKASWLQEAQEGEGGRIAAALKQQAQEYEMVGKTLQEELQEVHRKLAAAEQALEQGHAAKEYAAGKHSQLAHWAEELKQQEVGNMQCITQHVTV